MNLVLLFSFSFAKILADENAALTNKDYRLNIHSLLLAQNCIITFRFLDEPMTWSEANEACKNMGARLVEIDSKAENNRIVKEIRKMGYKERHFWMGLTDLRKEGVWRLESTGRKPSYTNWAAGEPNDAAGGEDCAHLRIGPRPNYNDTWVDQDCKLKIDAKFHKGEYKFFALCESVKMSKIFSIGILPVIIESSTKIDFPCRQGGCPHPGTYSSPPSFWRCYSCLRSQEETSKGKCRQPNQY